MSPNYNAMFEIKENLLTVKSQIANAAIESGREPVDVNLVAVTKTLTEEKIRLAILAGHTIFGENRVQETEGKWPTLRDEFARLQLHLIGPLQSNKVRRAVQLFDVIETIDRPKLARAIAREIENFGWPLKCFIQVNTGEEPQKAGVLPENLDRFVALCRDELALPIVGLMCIPPHDEEPGLHFGLLAEMARRNGLVELSMGMSRDFETAIQFGATYVRIGTAVFGEREPFNGLDE